MISTLPKNLPREDRVNIAVYYSQQKVLPSMAAGVDEALSSKGAALFKRTCGGCHGQQGQGMETMPRLAGQPGDYIRKALTRFRNNDPARAGSVMMGIASQLSEADIEALAAYLSRLQLTSREEQASLARIQQAAAR